jgi:hypothetical protein
MQRRSQIGRPRRNGRSNVKTRVGIAAAALALGGGAVAAVVASHGPASVTAQSSSYNSRFGMTSEWGLLNSAVSGWGSSMGTSMAQLASVHQQTFSQTSQHGKTLDVQRGIVVFASPHFLIMQSKNGTLHLWALSGHTQFENVATSMSGTTALTASSTASRQAVNGGEMIPAVNMMVGDATTAASLLTPNYQPQTVTVQVAGTDLTVTVTITRSTATTSQTATVPNSGSPVSDPSTMTTSAWSTAGMTSNLARGDLAMVVGTRSHGLLHAQIILYSPLSAGDVGGYLGGANPPQPAATVSPSPGSTQGPDSDW